MGTPAGSRWPPGFSTPPALHPSARRLQDSGGTRHTPPSLNFPHNPFPFFPPTQGFPTEATRKDGFIACATNVRARCLDGARYGCTLDAARRCAPPAWKAALRLAPSADADAERRAACEAYHRHQCARAALAACGQHAGEFCARVVGAGREGEEEDAEE